MSRTIKIRIVILFLSIFPFSIIAIKAQSIEDWSKPYRGWHYYPDLIIPPNPDIPGYGDVKMTDVPTVFQIPGDDLWYMSFIGFDGQGYQSFIAESEDLIHWSNYRLAMGYGPEGGFDFGGVVLGAYLYEEYDIKAPRILKKKNGNYYSLYGAYPRQGGYELRPGYEGIALSNDGLTWQRAKDEPILSVYQDDCGEWEQSCIYQPWLIEHEDRYYNLYNAANGSIEQMGMAISDDLMNWKRYRNNPVIPHGPKGSYNEKFSSDIKVFWDTDHWVGFFFGVGQGGAHIMAAYSTDLYQWIVDPEPLYQAGGNPSGIDDRYAHKISLIWNPANETYYMFYCAVDEEGNRGIGLITSKQITHLSTVWIDELKCEYRDNPLGIDILSPRLSWHIKAPGVRGEKQTAYRIIVASSLDKLEEGKADLWDSDLIQSDQSTQVTYKGKKLQSEMQCYWKVMVWNKDGKASAWSKPASWSMGLLNPDDWNAKWISSHVEDTSPWYRHQFNIDKVPDKATVYLASLGYFELYINGHRIGNEVLAPVVSNFSKRSYYQTFDIASYLLKGDNCIAVWMGQGWYSPGLPGIIHHSPVIRAQLNMIINGQERSEVSDTTWLSHRSSRTLLGSWRWGNFGGELLDARLHNTDWNMINISTADWDNTVEVVVADVPCSAQNCSGNGIQNPIMPISIEQLDTNKILVDFGTNLTGFMHFKFRSLNPGEKITMYYADKDARNTDFLGHGGLMQDGFSILGQYDEFISAGAPEETFTNVFNYHAFRYAIIEGLPNIPEKEDIAAVPVSGKLDVDGSFSCSNELYNRINDMVVWTYNCLNLGGQTVDCPHRERLGYGDGQTIMDLGCFNFYAPALYSKWSQNWWDEQLDDGFVPFTAPCPHSTGGGPAWGAMCVMVPWKTYLFYNDKRLLHEGYPYMKKYIEYLNSHCENGILMDIFPGERWPNLGDWVPPRRGMDKSDWVDDTSRKLFNNCYRIHLLQIMQKIATILGNNDDKKAFEREMNFSQQKIHETFFRPKNNTYANGEQPYLIFPLQTGVTPDSLVKVVFDKYVETLLDKDEGHLNTGMIGTQIMTDYLIENDRNDLIDTFVNQTTYPGWGYMVENGATTCWEQWNGYYSQIHSCFPYIGGWFYKGLAGIQWDPDNPGFKHVILRPGLVKSVDWVKCSYQSPYGEIVSNWKTRGDLFEWQISIPVNSSATVYIPGNDIQESERDISGFNTITFLRQENNFRVYKIESGKYALTVRND